MELEVITPPVADETDPLEHFLVALTEAISQVDGGLVAHGFLGGQYGYGADYENDTFMMHHFCWCEREDCRWCSEDACGCEHLDPRYYIDGKEVSADESWRWNSAFLGPLPHNVADHGTPEYEAYSKEWDKRVKERDRRMKMVWPARIHRCEPRGMMADRAEGDTCKPSQSAPNFWHKPSGLKVWWYKWIGRDMEVAGAEDIDINAIAAECLASLPRTETAQQPEPSTDTKRNEMREVTGTDSD